MQNLPIGIFDSGMGGLTVLRELKRRLPNESFIYLGDTARLPYGTKSPETVKQYALQMTDLLVKQGIKLMVVACNTATATALPYLQQYFPKLPIIGVVEPGAKAAITAAKNHNIIVLATETTINCGAYQSAISQLAPNINVVTKSCGLFVALAEEAYLDGPVAEVVITECLASLRSQLTDHDCVLLGCTHFPVLLKPLTAALGHQITIINSAQAVAITTASRLKEAAIVNNSKTTSTTAFFVTDLPQRFSKVGEIFLGEAIDSKQVQLINPYSSIPLNLTD